MVSKKWSINYNPLYSNSNNYIDIDFFFDSKHARYNLCMQALQRFVSSSQTINVCMDSRFDEKMQSIEPDDRIMSIEKQCKTFDTKTCITNVLNGAWDTINQRYNLTELSSSFSIKINNRQPRKPHGSHSAISITFVTICCINICGINISVQWTSRVSLAKRNIFSIPLAKRTIISSL